MTDQPTDDLGLHPSKRRCPLPDCGLWRNCDHTVADVFDRIAELEASLRDAEERITWELQPEIFELNKTVAQLREHVSRQARDL